MNSLALPLVLSVEDDRTVVNEFLYFEDLDDTRVVFLHGILMFHYLRDDRDTAAFVIATLARGGHARVQELARAFGVDRKTVYRYRRRLEEEGPGGVLEKKRGPRGPWKIDSALRRRILDLKAGGRSDRAVGRMVGIDHSSVARVLREEGYQKPAAPVLPSFEPEEEAPSASVVDEAEEEKVVESSDATELVGSGRTGTSAEATSPVARPVVEAITPRIMERALAARGGLVEAAPVLVSGENLRGAGLLLALPCLIELGILSVTEKVYRGLKPGFYGLRSFVLTLLFMALFRIKRPEGLKDLPPEVLGRLLGLDRSPEVKTVRRKLTEISARGKSHELLSELAKRIREDDEDLLGFLYVDGHVRAYHGKRKLPKTWSAMHRLCLPATTDYWVNDAEGAPFFFVTTEGNPSMCKILPELMKEVKGLLGGRKATVIFDRGGWSEKSLEKIMALGFDFITYRRRPYDDIDEDAFEEFEFEVEGEKEKEKVRLAEGRAEYVRLGTMRIVVKQDPDGHQVHIVTSATEEDLTTVEVYLRMVRRWRQENFFKYMKQELALDCLVSYEMVPADGERQVLNPKWKEADRRVREQRKKVRELERKLGAGSKEPTEGNRPTLMAFKASMAETAGDMIRAEQELGRRVEIRKAIPKRKRLKEAVGEPQYRLEFERKIFTDVLKMAAYRAETALVNAVASKYSRARHEARKLIQSVLHASGDLVVDDETVTVRLEPQSSPHRTKILEGLCAVLSAKKAIYPGTNLRLRYEVRGAADGTE